MNFKRLFVHHRNDTGIPVDREVKVIEEGGHQYKDYPSLSVIIPTVDGVRNGYFESLMKQLKNQTFQNFEIIVIKGDSRQGRAINTGVDIARGKYIMTLDDDTSLVNEESIEHLVKALDKDKKIGIAGGINVIPQNASNFVKRTMEEIPRRMTPPVQVITDSDLAEHPLMIMRKKDFILMGGENEKIPRGLDPYLRNKFRQEGYRVVVVPKATYSHLTPPNILELVKQFYRNGKQAAFCNKSYPQWVFETPPNHTDKFLSRRPFHYRFIRYASKMMKSLLSGHWIYLSVSTAYAIGFIWQYTTRGGSDTG